MSKVLTSESQIDLIKSPHRFVCIGFVANNEDDCDTCDSWIGFGDYSIGCGSNTIRAFGYIFVQ